MADWLGRSLKGRVVCIHADLGNHGCNRNIIHFAVIEFLSQGILQVVANIGLAHSHTDGERGVWLVCVLAAQCSHCIVNHTHLRAVAMGNDDLTAFFNKVYDGLGRNLDCFHLLRKGIAQCIAAKGDDNTFFLVFHSDFPLYRTGYEGIPPSFCII